MKHGIIFVLVLSSAVAFAAILRQGQQTREELREVMDENDTLCWAILKTGARTDWEQQEISELKTKMNEPAPDKTTQR